MFFIKKNINKGFYTFIKLNAHSGVRTHDSYESRS
jgi:hypothetical protein